MKNNIIIYLIKVILLTFICNIGYSLENKIIFKINNKAFTTIDYDFRIFTYEWLWLLRSLFIFVHACLFSWTLHNNKIATFKRAK